MRTNLSARKGLLYFGVPLVFAAVITGSVVAVRAQVGGNPDAGLTDAQRDAKYTSLEKTSVAISSSFNATFVAGGDSVSNLPRVEDQALYAPSGLDLSGASAKASEIVRGVVIAQRLEASGPGDGWDTRIISTVRVTRYLKGAGGSSTIELSQPASVTRDDQYKVYLEYAGNDAPPQLNDDVILFAGGRNERGYLTALPYKILAIIGGNVEPNPLDIKLTSVHGQRADAVLSAIATDATQASQ